MKKAILSLFFVLCIASVAVSQTVPNSGFESWTGGNPDSWSGDTNLVAQENTNSTYVHGGSKSAQLVIDTGGANGDRDFIVTDFITGITEGQEYTCSGWVYDNDADTRVRLQFHFFDASDTELDSGNPAYDTIYTSDQTSFQHLQFTRTAPTGSVKCKVGLRAYLQSGGTVAPGQIVYVDDVSISSGAPTATDVANIAAARATTGAVRITGTVIVNCGTAQLNGTRNQFYIQDSSGTDGQSGLCIDDPSTKATHKYYPGDRLTNLTGTMGDYAGAAQLGLSADPGAATPGAAPTPLLVSFPIADINAVEGELIRIEGVSLDGGAVGNYLPDTNLTVKSGADTIVMRIEDQSELVGTPQTPGLFDVAGIATEFNATQEIEPRFLSDITPFTGTAARSSWNLYE